jgi:hypothetical protein
MRLHPAQGDASPERRIISFVARSVKGATISAASSLVTRASAGGRPGATVR